MTSLAGLYSNKILGYNSDPFCIAAQVVSGIGFLGAGMIIVKNGNKIIGLTTAFLTRIERKRKISLHFYIEINDLSLSSKLTDNIRECLSNDCLIEILSPKSGNVGNLGVFITTSGVKKSI